MKKIKIDFQNYKWLYGIIAAIICVVTAFVSMVALYFYKFDTTLEKENEGHLAEVAGQITAHTHSILDGAKTSMEVAADAIGKMQNKESVFDFLAETKKTMNFAYIGYADIDGILYTNDELEPENISEKSYFIAALHGDTVITELHRKILWDKAVSGVLVTTAVYDNMGEVSGVLVGMMDIKNLQSVINVESFNGNGFAYLVDPKGELVLRSKSMDYNNFFLFLQNVVFAKGYNYNKVLSDMKEQRQGIILFNNMGTNQYAYYYPLGVNDWMVVNIVAKSTVTANTASLTKELAFLCIISIIVFLILIFIAVTLFGISENRKHTAEVKTIFLANMSHELRTPMNAIIGTGELMRREKLTPKQMGYVHTITKSGKSLLKIINDILDFSKLESGKLTLINEPYHLRGLIVDITTMVILRIGSKPIKFVVDIDTEVPEKLIGDEIRVKQILVNLLSNAAKYTEKGLICLTITSQKEKEKIKLILAVSDTGTGIQKQDIEKLFISFNQVDTHHHHSTEGTGLGLAITKHLALQMDGDVTVKSIYGKGSTFTATIFQDIEDENLLYPGSYVYTGNIALYEPHNELRSYYHTLLNRLHISHSIYKTPEELWYGTSNTCYQYLIANKQTLEEIPGSWEKNDTILIPLYYQEEENIPIQDLSSQALYAPLFCLELADLLCSKKLKYEEESKPFEAKNKRSYQNARILIVDDNEFNQEITAALMEPYQMQIDLAGNGQEAVEAVKVKEYDLIFMDHMMPIMDGVEAFKCIRALPEPKYLTIPIVMLTANATREAQIMFYKIGFRDFLAKPIEMEKLDSILQKYLK